jgi:hypothetical protein
MPVIPALRTWKHRSRVQGHRTLIMRTCLKKIRKQNKKTKDAFLVLPIAFHGKILVLIEFWL